MVKTKTANPSNSKDKLKMVNKVNKVNRMNNNKVNSWTIKNKMVIMTTMAMAFPMIWIMMMIMMESQILWMIHQTTTTTMV